MTDNKEISPQNRKRNDAILGMVNFFQDAGKPVPSNFICGQRVFSDGRPVIQAFQLNVKEVTADGGINAEWSPPSAPPTPGAKQEIERAIQDKDRKGERYPIHCVPVGTLGGLER